MKRIGFVFIFLVLNFADLCAQQHQPTAYQLGIPVSNDIVYNRSRFFLTTKTKHGELQWSTGWITVDGVTKGPVPLKFDVTANIIYMKDDQKYYSIEGRKLDGFMILDGVDTIRFKSGYGQPREFKVEVQLSGNDPAALQYVLNYPDLSTLKIVSWNLQTGNNGRTSEIILQSIDSGPVDSFEKYLKAGESVSEVTVTSNLVMDTKNYLLEVLYQDKDIQVLKWHTKSLSQSESVALASNSFQNVFSEETYFFANCDNELVEFIFYENSIRNGLLAAGLLPPQKIPRLKKEEKLVEWLRNRQEGWDRD